MTEQGDIRYELKTPYRNDTTHMIFEPLDFISKLASLIPAPRINLTRFHGVFAPNSRHRSGIINRETSSELPAETNETESERHGAKTWTMRLKRAFDIDIKICESCGGCVRVIACVDNPVAIEQILTQGKARKTMLRQMAG